MSDVAALLLRAGFTYVYLLTLVRLSGKRAVGEATAFDFVIALVIGDMPDGMIFGDIPLIQGAVAMGALFALHALVALLAYRSPAVDWLVNPPAAMVIENGQVRHRELARERVSEAELAALLRECGPASAAEVELARLEPSGMVTAQRPEPRRAAAKRDLAG
jgi:uncharacterized membrane protein YcaP (DUF421 family)